MQCSPISDRPLLFGRFPRFACLSWQEQHVGEEECVVPVDYHWQGTPTYPVQNLYQCHLSIANLTLTDLGSNPGLCSDRPATNRLSYSENMSTMKIPARKAQQSENIRQVGESCRGKQWMFNVRSYGTHTARKKSRVLSVKPGGACSSHYAKRVKRNPSLKKKSQNGT